MALGNVSVIIQAEALMVIFGLLCVVMCVFILSSLWHCL